ncbi:MAG TPA: gamma-glutamylcyclotransferase family protein [Candidatus Angelobacter sp.]
MSALLFVYGTLKRGGKLHHELAPEKAHFLGLAKIRGELFHLKGVSWPGAFPSESRSRIQGELYKLLKPAETLKRLDRVEATHEGLFTRKLVDVWAGSSKMRSWVYFCGREEMKSERIRTGNFRATTK